MTEPFLLPVYCNGSLCELPARLVILGYIYQFHIEIEGRVLIFEKDEERNYRVMDNTPDARPVGKDLLSAVVAALNALQEER